VRCVGAADAGGSCPPEQVVGRQTSRPHLGLALAVAAGVTIGGAVEAFLQARSERGSTPTFVATASGADIILYSMRAP
jgi:hypothetical protein